MKHHSIELLESRIAPAILTPVVTKGILTIQHDTGGGDDLVITQTGADAFTVVDTAPNPDTNYGTFTGVKGISVTFSGSGSSLDLKVSAAGLAGPLTVSATGGTNSYKFHPLAGATGAITGKVNIIGAGGDDSVQFIEGIAVSQPVTFKGHDGVDSISFDDAYLAKKLTLDSVENITTATGKPNVIGGMLVENEEANGNVVFDISNVSTIAGSLTYCGSDTVDDNVTLTGQITGPALLMLLNGTNNVFTAGTFLSSLKITGGTGLDSVTFDSRQTNFTLGQEAYANPLVVGPLTIKLGNGANDVTFNGGATFSQAVTVTTGTGADTVNFTKFNAAKSVTLALGAGSNSLVGTTANLQHAYIGGLFKYTGGVDSDTLDLNHLIAGTMLVNLGNGVNGVTGAGRILGKSATILGGTGVDTLNFGLTSGAAALTVKLNAGDDAFTFLGGALTKATIDGGSGPNDTLTGLALLPAVKKITNFETQS